MLSKIFLCKETRAGESRVALIPEDIKMLIDNGYSVVVESDAGLKSGYLNQQYQEIGASIISVDEENIHSYKQAFSDIHLIVRAKRPCREREILENKAMRKGTVMIGALDPFEPNSTHIDEYHHADIHAYSLDQVTSEDDNDINVLKVMSNMAGRLALRDALEKLDRRANTVVVIGLGSVGQSVIDEALNLGLSVDAIVGNVSVSNKLTSLGVNTHIVDRSLPLTTQQEKIGMILKNADITIASARRSSEKAPLLVTKSTINNMKTGSVIVDMAISEGGNVDGSEHDNTIESENGVLITNVSGYPKAMPKEASIQWSKVSLTFILRYLNELDKAPIRPL